MDPLSLPVKCVLYVIHSNLGGSSYPTKALNWISIALILPVIGFLLYLSISNSKLIKRKRLTSPHNETDKLPDTFSDSALVIANALRHFTVNGLPILKPKEIDRTGIVDFSRWSAEWGSELLHHRQ